MYNSDPNYYFEIGIITIIHIKSSITKYLITKIYVSFYYQETIVSARTACLKWIGVQG